MEATGHETLGTRARPRGRPLLDRLFLRRTGAAQGADRAVVAAVVPARRTRHPARRLLSPRGRDGLAAAAAIGLLYVSASIQCRMARLAGSGAGGFSESD